MKPTKKLREINLTARSPEEPFAGKLHAGICEGHKATWCPYLNLLRK
jgi:hypothetical protein